MKYQKLFTTLIAFLAITVFVGCNADYTLKNSSLTACQSNCTTGDPTQPDPWGGYEFKAVVDGGPYSSQSIAELDKVNNMIIVKMPIPVSPIGEVSGDIKQIDEARFHIREDASGDWFVEFHIPVEAFVDGIRFQDPERLPNGDSLPGIPGGELPSIALEVDRTDYVIHLYLGVSAIGIFYPTPNFDPKFALSWPIKTQNKRKTVGYFALVPEKRDYDGGVFLSVLLPEALSRLIDDLT